MEAVAIKNQVSASELRIGNYLKYNGTPDMYVRVQPSDILAIYQIEIANKAGVKRSMDYQYIPLTDEIMNRIKSFERVKFEPEIRGEYSLGKYHVSISKGKLIIVNTLGMTHTIGDCRYLHELQNWFHLFGKDLEITL